MNLAEIFAPGGCETRVVVSAQSRTRTSQLQTDMSNTVEQRGQIFSALLRAGRRGLLLACLLAGFAGAVPAWAQVNNNFASAEVIAGLEGFTVGSSLGATRETNEPIHYVGSPLSANSVWFRWVQPWSW